MRNMVILGAFWMGKIAKPVERGAELGDSMNCPADVIRLPVQILYERIAEGRNGNAWLLFEFQVIAMGAGWYEGMTFIERGTPRPPLCGVYQE